MIVDLILGLPSLDLGGAAGPSVVARPSDETKPSSSVALDMRLQKPHVKGELNRSVQFWYGGLIV
jgi:hypothetical protein